jgi:hypothetical protein
MNTVILSFVLLTAVSAFPAVTGEKSGSISTMIPDTVHDDFESGEMNAWESYPIAQDPGFDPETWCVREPAFGGSRYSLCKVIEPNDTDWPRDENLVGLTKKIRLWTRADTKLSLELFAEGDRRPAEIRVVLYGGDGSRYIWSQAGPKANEWIPVQLSLADFQAAGKPLAPGILIEAVTVLACYGPLNPHRSYSLFLDDFNLYGERPRRFTAADPTSTYLDKFFFTFLNRHFHRGEMISLKASLEPVGEPLTLESLMGVLLDPAGKPVIKGARFKPAAGGVWESGPIHRIGPGDSAGRWKIVLEGKSHGGARIVDELFFLVPERRFTPADHPRLFFDAGDLEAWMNGPMDPNRRRILDEALASARLSLLKGNLEDITEPEPGNPEFLDGGPVSPSWDVYERWFRPGAAMRNIVSAGAFLYAFAGDREAGLKARTAMIRFAEFKNWQHPWFLNRNWHTYYPVGLWMQAMGIGYDLLYPLFSPEDRAAIRKAVMEKAIIPHYRDWAELNRKPSNVTNHIGMNSTGMLLAALAFLGEDPDNPDLEPCLSGILAKYKAHIDAGYRSDGSYAEPEAYAGTDTEDLVKGLAALERNLGIDWTTTTQVKDAYLYQLYLSTANGRGGPAFGDGGRDWGFSLRNLHLWLAHRTQDPSALERYRWQTESGAFPPDYSVFDFLWCPDPAVRPKPVTENPPSRGFGSKGNAVFRSGWDEDALIFALRIGPHSNHYHLDQGTFWLLYNGETLLSEAGYTNYYRNLYYRQFYIQPIAHNTLLLGGYPESQRLADLDDEVSARNEFPRITSCFTGGSLDAVEGELSSVYKGRLSKYSRSFVYLKHADTLVLCDEIEAVAPERYSWVFHAEGKDAFRGEGNSVRVVRPSAELRMDILGPERLERTVKAHPDRDGSYILLSTPETSDRGRFLAVLIPSSAKNRAERDSWKTVRFEAKDWSGVEIGRGEVTDRVLFRKGGGDGPQAMGDWETDGDRAALTISPGGRCERIWVRNATVLREVVSAGIPIFQSDRRLSFLADFATGGALFEVDSETATVVTIWTGREPGRVSLDGASIKHPQRGQAGAITLDLPPGQHKISVN